MKGVFKKVLVVVTICILCFAGCADKAKYNYILGNGVVVDNGKRPTEGADPFSNKGIYADPEIKTVQVLIMSLNSTAGAELGDLPFVMAAAFISSLPIILLFILMNKAFVQTNATAGIKG